MAKGEGAHVVIFPGPAQGHVGSMLNLAELLALGNIHVTFLNTDYIQNRLIGLGEIEGISACYPNLQFKTISDCYKEGQHPGFGHRVGDIIASINLHGKPLLRDIIVSLNPKVTCIIVDGIFGSLATDLAKELAVPLIHFRTVSACSFWAYSCAPKLLHCNELPIRGIEDMDRIITNIPGMENLLRCRDLPSFFRPNKDGLFPLQSIVSLTQQSLGADALILNTCEHLEGPVLSQIRLQFPKLYTPGPLHHHLSIRKIAKAKSNHVIPSFNSSFFEMDRSCMTWLNAQEEKSVIYVSFGSCTLMKREEVMEIWHGLVKSKKQFLWVMRPDLVGEEEDNNKTVPLELEEGTKERGFLVGWAPQKEVLAHKAVGGFLTHSGWNSTLESVVAGVPMICWPYFADQQINSRFVSEVWRIGLDMKDICDRNIVKNMVNDIMEHRKEEFLKSAQEMAASANNSVSPGGSSYSSLDDLIHYILSTSKENH